MVHTNQKPEHKTRTNKPTNHSLLHINIDYRHKMIGILRHFERRPTIAIATLGNAAIMLPLQASMERLASYTLNRRTDYN